VNSKKATPKRPSTKATIVSPRKGLAHPHLRTFVICGKVQVSLRYYSRLYVASRVGLRGVVEPAGGQRKKRLMKARNARSIVTRRADLNPRHSGKPQNSADLPFYRTGKPNLPLWTKIGAFHLFGLPLVGWGWDSDVLITVAGISTAAWWVIASTVAGISAFTALISFIVSPFINCHFKIADSSRDCVIF